MARKKEKTKEELLAENAELHLRLNEAEETLQAIRQGEVDALVVSGPRGDQVYSLQGVEHTYRVLVESMNEGALTLTESGNIIYCNKAFAAMAGIACGKLVSVSFRDLVSAKHKERFDSLWKNALTGIATGEIELKLKGGRVPVNLSCGTRVQDEVLTVFVVATDISERKRAEDTLRKAHDELGVRVQERTQELEVNETKLEAQNHELVLTRENLRKLNEQLEQRIIQRTRFYSLVAGINEAIVKYRDRRELLDEVCRIMVETGNFKLAWIGIVDTTTREVRQEERCGATSYLEGIRIVAANTPEGQGPTGRAIAEGRHVINADFEKDPHMMPWRERALAHGIRSSSAFPLYSGGLVIGALTIYSDKPSFFTDEEIALLLSIMDNISFALDAIAGEKKRVEAEEALKRLNEELEQRVAERTADLELSNKELADFSHSVSHDLRAPLRHMMGFAELFLRKLKDHPEKESQHYAELIVESSKKMGVLIDNLLDFSRLGRAELKKRKVNLNTLVAGVALEMQDDLKGRKIRWDIDKLPVAFGDEPLLRLVLVNLISNAVKFTRTRPQAEISIGCKDEGTKFTCSVADNGVGFDMEFADKLFGVFQRLHTQQEFEGTGIGLANVQRIIARHGGKVWAEGAVGKGATFYFSLPKPKEA